MYPTLADIINDFFGTNFSFPIQSYGMMVALAFLTGGYIIMLELKRKEKEGLLSAQKKRVLKGKPASTKELIISGVFGFIIGFKIAGIIINYSAFNNDPQSYILSGEGNFLGGVLIGAISAYMRYREKQKQKLPKPEWVEQTVRPYELTGNIILLAAIFGIIGAKIFHNLENFGDLIDNPAKAIFSFSGLTFYGGLIVGPIAVLYYTRKNKINWHYMIDAAAPAIILAYAVGRSGCMISGDGCWGIANLAIKPEWLSFLPDWMWAYNFPHNVVNEGIPIADCAGKHCFILNQPVFPTSFYETTISVIFFIVLWSIRKKIKIPGMLFSILLIMNGTERFFIEKIRVNTEYNIFGWGITQAEIISTLLFLTGIAGVLYFKHKYQTKELKN